MPAFIFDIIKAYKTWWQLQKIANGNKWYNSERLFIQADGSPINPDTINFWIDKFVEKHNLPHFTPHSLRHTFCTLQIMAGVNIRTLQARSGHAQASTLVNIYSHAIKTADELATEELDDILTPKKYK
jgi:integrase